MVAVFHVGFLKVQNFNSRSGAEGQYAIPCQNIMEIGPNIVGVLWPNGWMDEDETWHGCKPHPRQHCVRWGPSSSLQKGHTPQFSSHVCCGQTAGWIKMLFGTEVGLGPGNIVLDGDPATPAKNVGAATPTFRPMYCGHTAGWINLPLGTDVGLASGRIVC